MAIRIGKPRNMATLGVDSEGGEDPSISFVSESQDVEAIKDYLGNSPALDRFGAFFVQIPDADPFSGTGGGEYTGIWGMEGIIPVLTKPIYRITQSSK